MCNIVEREGTAKFGGDICIGSEDIARKREGGLEIAPPSGARVKSELEVIWFWTCITKEPKYFTKDDRLMKLILDIDRLCQGDWYQVNRSVCPDSDRFEVTAVPGAPSTSHVHGVRAAVIDLRSKGHMPTLTVTQTGRLHSRGRLRFEASEHAYSIQRSCLNIRDKSATWNRVCVPISIVFSAM